MKATRTSKDDKPLERLLMRAQNSGQSTGVIQSMTSAIAFQLKARCCICNGHGHLHNRCSVRRVIRNTLKRAGNVSEWKQLKVYINQKSTELTL